MRFPYLAVNNIPASYMPRLPLRLRFRNRSLDVLGLLDTGSVLNVVPYQVGLALGAIWEDQTTPLQLSGNLAQHEARALILYGSQPLLISNEEVELVFAWTRSDNAPILLGQINFFLEFDVCFYKADNIFDVRRR